MSLVNIRHRWRYAGACRVTAPEVTALYKRHRAGSAGLTNAVKKIARSDLQRAGHAHDRGQTWFA
jgi:hypothetical protein